MNSNVMKEAQGKMILDSEWVAARSIDVQFTGIQLTTTHPPSTTTTPISPPWMQALVPGTVLATLVKNKLVPDPFYGLGNEAILDIADSGRDYYTFWFFTTFQCKLVGILILLSHVMQFPSLRDMANCLNLLQSVNQNCDLNFRGINYSADVYLNGHKMVLPKGMFRRHSLDVTGILNPNGSNLLAVLVYPPDHPGTIPPQGGQGGDHEIGKDVATQYVEGWDWIAPIRDRNTGIWDEVSISITGPVKLIDPHLVSSFFDNYKRVYLHATTEVDNRSSSAAKCSLNIQGTTELEGSVQLVEHLQTQMLSVPAKSRVQFTFPELFFYKPNLWWPNGMGKQNLYDVVISIDVEGFGESDSWSHLFGFRKIESHIDAATGGRYGCSKSMENQFSYEAVWQEFWITGDVDGRGIPVSNPNGPLDHDLFLFCARDTIKLLRNHASLALWVGGNEQIPPKDINAALKSDLKLHPFFKNVNKDGKNLVDLTPSSPTMNSPGDPSQYLDGTRIYIEGSLWDGFADGEGNFTDGPYEIQNPEDFFKDSFYKYGFNPEVGSVGMSVAATIRATMPSEGWQIPLFNKLSNGYVEEVPNPIWKYHKYIPYSKPTKVHDQIQLYGVAKDLDDFCLKAQLVNYIQYRALLEGWTSHMWSKYTGVLIWKTQNPWTGLRGQFYDHLLDQTAGFYGCRCAAEPIHVQLNLDTYFIEVVNTTSEKLFNMAIEASVWDLDGMCPYYKAHDSFTMLPKQVTPIFEMDYPKSEHPKPVYFLLLKLYDKSDNRVLSRNLYWLHLPGGDYKLLEPYRKQKIPLKITSEIFTKRSNYRIRMHVENISKGPKNETLTCENSSTEHETGWIKRLNRCIGGKNDGLKVSEIKGNDMGVAFFLKFSVHASKKEHKEGEDTRILPVHYSDNYFSLVPGEAMTVEISFEVPQGVTPRVTLQGWNYSEGHTVLEAL
ncbi:hypothetical protein PIB30_041737 [Stylosanthes scabra]|uniref:Mannosylglycoprotein endo-beta-mannosidase n=1 Tax=Stylosanthes scabra TaxID=79078 RepID=A0ABU6ZDT5_9FABA|nr:hypothetical protein [Stylosanthes scabra]